MLRVLAAVLAGEGARLDVDALVGHARAALAKPAVPGLGTANSGAAYSYIRIFSQAEATRFAKSPQ